MDFVVRLEMIVILRYAILYSHLFDHHTELAVNPVFTSVSISIGAVLIWKILRNLYRDFAKDFTVRTNFGD